MYSTWAWVIPGPFWKDHTQALQRWHLRQGWCTASQARPLDRDTRKPAAHLCSLQAPQTGAKAASHCTELRTKVTQQAHLCTLGTAATEARHRISTWYRQ